MLRDALSCYEIEQPPPPLETRRGEEESGHTQSWSDILDLTLDDYIRHHRPSLLLIRDSDEESCHKEAEAEQQEGQTQEEGKDRSPVKEKEPGGQEDAQAKKNKRARKRGGGGQQKRREALQKVRAYRERVALTVEAQQASLRAAQAYSEQDQEWVRASAEPAHVV